MDVLRAITDFADEVTRLRRTLQEGRCLTRDEAMLLQNALTVLQRELEQNQKRRIPVAH